MNPFDLIIWALAGATSITIIGIGVAFAAVIVQAALQTKGRTR